MEDFRWIVEGMALTMMVGAWRQIRAESRGEKARERSWASIMELEREEGRRVR